ncbi:SulP family inorganic anion transporter [Nitrosomonas ureae]|uniref:Sulfate permease, MFS superfamily n=1 Tax=Nitrosomonas ureae TaxID=44577 RepID=A0A1H5TML1_9PROT|nr:SulP family inorganic anion transporter [Nitrosomonas ureae]SEF64020.1 Sulfate permease, MFS superfamily [Nitrosomonas ureae]
MIKKLQWKGFSTMTWKDVQRDFLASVVVFLVALPLCMGIAIASGVPPVKGIITGIIGGLVVGFLAGCPLQISGPAAGLTVLIFDMVQRFGVDKLGIVVLMAGAIQILAGFLQLGQWFRAVSPAVIQGMLAGIGVLILASQFHIMIGDTPKENGLENILTIPEAMRKGLIPHEGDDPSHWVSAHIGILTITVIILWQFLVPKKFQFIPAPLVGVLVASGVAYVQNLSINYIEFRDSLDSSIHFPGMEDFASLLDPSLLSIAISIAFIASAETLLCAAAVDQMHSGQRTRYNREMSAQGIGNFLCGFLGALPMTGVIVRSKANIQSGGRTRVSAILHGGWLLLFAGLFPQILELVPIASLAALLVYTGYNLINVQAIRTLSMFGRGEVVVYAVTLVTIVTTNLLIGVLAGFGVALAKLIYSTNILKIFVDQGTNSKSISIKFSGAATFVSLPKMANILDDVPLKRDVHLDFDDLRYIDHACLNLLVSWKRFYEARNGTVSFDWKKLENRLVGGKWGQE